jgi:hypothetical protein
MPRGFDFVVSLQKFRFELLAGLTILCSEINGNNFGIKGLKNKNQGRFSPYPLASSCGIIGGKNRRKFSDED